MSVSPSINFSSLAEMYEGVLVEPLFRPWVDDLLQRAELKAGDRVLDIACGTGIVARVARQRLGDDARVVGVDASEPMLAVAKRVAPGIEWRAGNVMALPVDVDDQFDVVTCQQGLQFFPDRLAAAREMRRVLADGGRLAVATWRPLDAIPFFRELHALAEQHLGPVVDQRHAFGVPSAIEALLREAGFGNVRVDQLTRTIRVPDAATFFQMNAHAIVGMSPKAKAMDDAGRAGVIATIAAESGQLLARYGEGDGVAFELSTNVAVARA
jgi:ubiquinone/menaquinone biosynthesis C-methylase UbiE